MILLCGIPSEPPLMMVRERLEAAGAHHTVVNQRRVAGMDIEVDVDDEHVHGELRTGDLTVALEAVTGVYLRLMDHRLLPEVEAAPAGADLQTHAARFHDALVQWCEVTPAAVVNRLAPMGSNGSKPYQAQLIAAHGFAVPDTLVSNDPAEVLAFRDGHGSVVYKSMSGVRSVVHRLDDTGLARLDRVRWCPVQFQEYVAGRDVRVHCVGHEAFATAVDSDADDYRYAAQQGGSPARLSAVDLDAGILQRCVELTAGLRLAFSGIDLRLCPDGRVFCFEVNPCPGYTYYESHTGQPISAAVARYLMQSVA
jgi:glutathione synthase/RimK-type ligase-like ATP-grasp enzyme